MIFLIVNMVIGIVSDILFVMLLASDGLDKCIRAQGASPERVRRQQTKVTTAILNGIVHSIPIINILSLLLYLIAYLIFNRKKGS